MASGQGALRRPHAVDAVESSRCGWPHTADRGLLLKLGGSLPLYSQGEGVVVGQLDPDRQVELDELLAALAATESPLDDPVSMYLREVASLDCHLAGKASCSLPSASVMSRPDTA